MGNCTSGQCNFNPNKRSSKKIKKLKNNKKKESQSNDLSKLNNTVYTNENNKNRNSLCSDLNIIQCTNNKHINDCRWDPFALINENTRIIGLNNSIKKGKCVGISKSGLRKSKKK